MSHRLAFWMVLAPLCLPATARADAPSQADTSGLTALAQGLQALKAGRSKIEDVYMLALGVDSDDGSSGSRNAEARKLLTSFREGDGLTITRPDLDAFERLAKWLGTRTDVEFFKLLHRTYPDSHRRIYVIETGADSHCTNFAPHVFVPLYGDWLKFAKRHPDNYTEPSRREIEAIEHAMMSDRCACTSQRAVTKALRAFVRAYPRGNVTPEVEGRLDQIRYRRPDFTFNCQGQE